jgi:hypothetical protein
MFSLAESSMQLSRLAPLNLLLLLLLLLLHVSYCVQAWSEQLPHVFAGRVQHAAQQAGASQPAGDGLGGARLHGAAAAGTRHR